MCVCDSELEGKDVEEVFTAVLRPNNNQLEQRQNANTAAGNKTHTHQTGTHTPRYTHLVYPGKLKKVVFVWHASHRAVSIGSVAGSLNLSGLACFQAAVQRAALALINQDNSASQQLAHSLNLL